MASIEPQLWVDAPASAARFYIAAFGASLVMQVGEGEDVVSRLDIDGARFWVASADAGMGRRAPGEPQDATGRVLLVVPDPVAVVSAARAAGASVTAEVTEEHGWLVGRLVDPYGHEWEVGRHVGD